MPAGKEAQSDGKLKPSEPSRTDQNIPCAQVTKRKKKVKNKDSVDMTTKM